MVVTVYAYKSITWVSISAIFNEQSGELEAFKDASSNLLVNPKFIARYNK